MSQQPKNVPNPIAVANYQGQLQTLCAHNELDIPTYDSYREPDKNVVNQWHCKAYMTLPESLNPATNPLVS
ncbi:MAG: hypothetical protein ACPG2Y_02790, partial [Acholeplasmataceae bacterium]